MNFRVTSSLVLLTLIGGCGPHDASAPVDSGPASVRSETIRGPVTLTVDVAPGVVRLSDEPVLTLTVRCESGVVVTMPPFGKSIGEFLIRDYHEPPPTADEGTDVVQQVYTLEPTRAGTLTIAPIAVRFQDNRADGDGKEHVVESEALRIEVRTIVGDAAPSLADLKPAAGPVELPATGPPAFVWMATALVVVTISASIWLIRRRHRQASQKPPLTPQQLARLELDQIIGRRQTESDVKTFYLELTGVVRRYIERSTGIRAPEQTTEEFLRAILTSTLFADEEQRGLRQFLESADLVKFAGYRPASDDIESSIIRAQEFIRLNPERSEDAAP